MKKYIPLLKKTQLFSGVGDGEISAMLCCLDTRVKNYKKGEYVFYQGEHINDIVVLAEGKLHIQNEDYWGNRSILAQITVGELFGAAHASPNSGALLNDVIAVEDSVVIFFDVKRILTTCSSACRFHTMVVQNLFFAISEKSKQLEQKLTYMSARSTRSKLIAYLSEESKRQNSTDFAIPFNRQQLADFLAVDRSAMSNELCKMRDEGLIEFSKNQFRLLEDKK